MKHQPILAYLLFTLFLGLKLSGQIGWHWVWIFAPLWVYALLTLTAGFIVGFRRGVKSRILRKELAKSEARIKGPFLNPEQRAKLRKAHESVKRPDVH